MKRVLPVLAVVLLLSTSAAFAEEGAGGPPPGGPPGQAGGEKGCSECPRGDRPKMTEEQKKEKFAEMKTKILAKIEEHKACVQKATDFDAMKACRPKHGGRGGGEGGWGKRGGGEGGEGRGPGGGEGRGPGGGEGRGPGGGEGRGPGGEGPGGDDGSPE